MAEEIRKEESRNEMTAFEELIEKVAQLPEREKEQIAFFVNGFIAARQTDKATA